MEAVALGQPRTKFHASWLGPPRLDLTDERCIALARAITSLCIAGEAPLLGDGAFAGNGAARVGDALVVTPSGRTSALLHPSELVEVVGFDVAAWALTYRSLDARAIPTSDTALHWVALRAHGHAAACLHAHVLATEDGARRAGIPISTHETEFGTVEDQASLEELMAIHPPPAHDAWVRRGHGVIVVGPSADAALARLRWLRARAG